MSRQSRSHTKAGATGSDFQSQLLSCMMTVGHEFHDVFQKGPFRMLPGARPHAAYLGCSTRLLKALGWAPCPKFPSGASGWKLESWERNPQPVSVWLISAFPEQDSSVINEMTRECLKSGAPLGIICQNKHIEEKKRLRELVSSEVHAEGG